MSLLVARMITPLIAAYFLHSKGVQPHASGKAMDKYLGLLQWSLDTRKAHAYSQRKPGFWGKVRSLGSITAFTWSAPVSVRSS